MSTSLLTEFLCLSSVRQCHIHLSLSSHRHRRTLGLPHPPGFFTDFLRICENATKNGTNDIACCAEPYRELQWPTRAITGVTTCFRKPPRSTDSPAKVSCVEVCTFRNSCDESDSRRAVCGRKYTLDPSGFTFLLNPTGA